MMSSAPGDRPGRWRALSNGAVLARAARLVISAPAFLRAHFDAYGADLPRVMLRENRLLDPKPPPRPGVDQRDGPIRLGWVGTLRCARSLDLLAGLAATAGPDLRIDFHGRVHAHAVPRFHDILTARPRIRWHGGYRYPDDLVAIYGGLDLVWAQDLWQRGGNSDWLLPNRLYEAGYFGCPVIAVAGTETAAWVTRNGTGFVVPAADATALGTLLAGLDRAQLAACRARILARPQHHFLATDAEVTAMLEPLSQEEPGLVAAPRPA